MIRNGNRLASVLAGLTVGVLLVAGPARAAEIEQAAPAPLPSVLACSTDWTTIIVGTEHDDVIRGTEGNDLIVGLGGDDTIFGGAGRDTILGGTGDDVLAGGPGDDCILGGAGSDLSVLWLFSTPNGNDDSHSVAYRYQY